MNPETLAIARENLISLGNSNPHPDQVAKEAQRLHEANKITPKMFKVLLLAFSAYSTSVSPETVAEFLRKVLNL